MAITSRFTVTWRFICAALIFLGVILPSKAHAFAEGPQIDPSAALRKIAFGSCAGQNKRQPIWQAIIATKPQLFIMLGDNVYGDVTSEDMWELKNAYRALKNHPDFSKARQSLPFLPIWDDHDYGVNDGGASFAYRQKSEQLFRDFWKIPPHPHGKETGEGLYRSHIIGPKGQRVQIILLDTRYFRSVLKKAPPSEKKARYVPDPAPAKTMLGKAQWAWLEEELKKPADLRLIVSSIQVLAQGHGWERWGNLPLERQKLLKLVSKFAPSNTIFLSGDRHLGALYKQADPSVATPLYEITSSSLNRPYKNAKEDGPLRLGEVYGDINFGVITIDWAEKKASLELRNGKGEAVRTTMVSF